MVENVEMQAEIGDSENGCDTKSLLLKKNFSWNTTPISSHNNFTNNPLSHSKSFRVARSKSNPHVLDGVVIPSANKKIKSLQQLISNRFSVSQVLSSSGNASYNNVRTKNNKLAPLAKAISFTSVTTTNQTLSTPTAIQLTKSQRRPFYSFNKFLLYCKVNKQLIKKLCANRIKTVDMSFRMINLFFM